MKKLLLAAPFIVSAASALALLIAHGSRVETISGVAFLVSSFACFLCVPVLSRKSLLLGYGAVLFPFAMFALVFALSPREVTTSVTTSGHIEWQENHSTEELMRELKEKSKEPAQPSDTARRK
ncbi:MAG: hypothetical protein NDI75_01755 [Candidatus Didemnitutus sp.]|nr:hypothetical protein [Candidatus Didemnitutus sp.]